MFVKELSFPFCELPKCDRASRFHQMRLVEIQMSCLQMSVQQSAGVAIMLGHRTDPPTSEVFWSLIKSSSTLLNSLMHLRSIRNANL